MNRRLSLQLAFTVALTALPAALAATCHAIPAGVAVRQQDQTASAQTKLPNPQLLQLSAVSNARQVMLGVVEYMQDNAMLPDATSLAKFELQITPYVKYHSLFMDIGTGLPFMVNRTLSKRTIASFKHPEATIFLYSAKPNALGNRIIGFVDGRTKVIPEASWPTLAASSHIH